VHCSAPAADQACGPSRSAALDGVRALAIVAVLAFHADYGWASGGYLGVDVFFVLSGYLITRVLLSTHRSWWGYRQFLVRRAVRLFPALVVAMTGASVVGLLVGVPAGQVGRCGGAAVAYVMNLPPAGDWDCPAIWHVTWSLAAEQQFYLVWPLVLAALGVVMARWRPSTGRGRGRGLRVAAVVCLVAYGLGLVRQVVGTLQGELTNGELEFSPDGRSLVLLLGCALALLAASRRAASRPGTVRRADVAALPALGVLAWCFAVGDIGLGLGDRWALPVAGAASMALVAALVHAPERSVAKRLLGARPVAWLGRVSYSLYLWHEVAYRVAEAFGQRGALHIEVLRFALSLALAAASYRWVEQPAQRWWRRRGEQVEPESSEQQVSGFAAAAAATGPTPSSRIPHQPLSPLRPAAEQPSTPAARR